MSGYARSKHRTLAVTPGPRSPDLRPRASGTAAALGLDEQLEIFAPIVVGDLLARGDRLDGTQDHLALRERALGVRPARVIGVAADVAARRSVHGPAAVDLEHVAAAGL